ncbi:hypothetical protein FF1_026272 [Malus domestica]
MRNTTSRAALQRASPLAEQPRNEHRLQPSNCLAASIASSRAASSRAVSQCVIPLAETDIRPHIQRASHSSLTIWRAIPSQPNREQNGKGCIHRELPCRSIDDMLIAQDEIFGPVTALMKFKTIEEAIQRANNTRYGLAAGIITKDLNAANTVSRSIRAGIIWINCYFAFDRDCPYGGYKMSGFARDFGMQAL